MWELTMAFELSKNLKQRHRAAQHQLALSTASLLILSACGGGGGKSGSQEQTSQGHVIDGYVSSARVFRDANGNNRFDLGEDFDVTDRNGFFDGLGGLQSIDIVVDDNGGRAVDTITGFPLSFTLEAPGEYSVITPVTTLVAGLRNSGMSTQDAEDAVKTVFGVSAG